jgi:crotonobetainyl-CoA:carnitine CoA-transferase CaiB-like acyl-CoA transferase
MSTAAPVALRGRRVLELADESGAYCGKLMADMGADVIKIEPPGGDPSRLVPPFLDDRADPGRSLSFLYLNTSKRGVTLDPAHERGREIFSRLAARSDLIVETLAPGRLEALGLGFETLRSQNPKLVLTSITGFGQTGPHRDFGSSELVAGAMGGAMYVTGEAEDAPVVMAGSQSLWMASTCAASSSMLALLHAGRSGRGQHVDISIQETTLAVSHISGVGKWLDDGIVPQRMGTGLFASVPSGTYRCNDGLVYLMVNRPAHWKALAQWINEETGNQEVLDPMFEGPSSNRIEYRELLDIYISDMTCDHSVEEIYHEGQRRHIAFTPVNGPRQVAEDPHLAAREYFCEVEQPGIGPVRQPGAPYHLYGTPWRIHRPAPGIGEHNHEVYAGELGLGEDELASLSAEGAI